MKSKIFLLFVSFVFLLFVSMKCKKEAPGPTLETLPIETQTGARTFGCLVDGKVWLPRSNFPYSSLSTVIQYDILSLTTSRSNEGIILGVRNMTNVGDYDLMMNNNYADYSIGDVVYKLIQGKLTITKYDKTNRILSGRFSFTGQDSITRKTVAITDGRFDVTFTN